MKPGDVAAQAATRTAAAQRTVKDAIVALNKTQEKAITGPDGTNSILKDIRRQLGGAPAKPSSTAKPRTDRGTRTGGR